MIKIAEILKHKENDIKTLWHYIKKYNPDMDEFGNITLVKGKAPYDCFVAHLDTVHQDNPEPSFFGEYVTSINGHGIGGDDKCGIIACLDLIEKLDNVKVVFFTEEERGGVGSKNFDASFLKDVKYVIEIDRKGQHDFIQNSGSVELCTDEFVKEFISLNKDYKTERGTFTDVNNLRYKVPVCMANISSGYYNPHSHKEYINLKHLQNTIDAIYKFAKRNKKIWEFECPKALSYYSYNWWEDNTKDTSLFEKYSKLNESNNKNLTYLCPDCGFYLTRKEGCLKTYVCENCKGQFTKKELEEGAK